MTLGVSAAVGFALACLSTETEAAGARGARQVRSTETSVAVLDGAIDPGEDEVFECPVAHARSQACGRVVAARRFGRPEGLVPKEMDHGTEVAAAIAKAAPGARLVALDVFEVDPDFGLPRVREQAVIAALTWVREHAAEYGMVAANLSYGWPHQLPGACDDGPLAEAIRRTRDSGIAVVVSTGNDGATTRVARPACVTAATSVGATRGGSGMGAVDVAWFSDRDAQVDFFAQGVDVHAGARLATGTSFSAALVSAAIARIQSDARARRARALSVDEVEVVLRARSTVLHGVGGDVHVVTPEID